VAAPSSCFAHAARLAAAARLPTNCRRFIVGPIGQAGSGASVLGSRHWRHWRYLEVGAHRRTSIRPHFGPFFLMITLQYPTTATLWCLWGVKIISCARPMKSGPRLPGPCLPWSGREAAARERLPWPPWQGRPHFATGAPCPPAGPKRFAPAGHGYGLCYSLMH